MVKWPGWPRPSVPGVRGTAACPAWAVGFGYWATYHLFSELFLDVRGQAWYSACVEGAAPALGPTVWRASGPVSCTLLAFLFAEEVA